jgi:hypothetical protein
MSSRPALATKTDPVSTNPKTEHNKKNPQEKHYYSMKMNKEKSINPLKISNTRRQ